MSSDVTYVVTTKEIDTVVVTSEQGVVVHPSNISSTLVTTPNEMLVSTEEAYNVVVTGLVGPQGQPGVPEEDLMYSKRVDFISDTLLYKGEAPVGSTENSGVWRVHKIVLGVDGDMTETWAGGTALFDKVWADRASLIYS